LEGNKLTLNIFSRMNKFNLTEEDCKICLATGEKFSGPMETAKECLTARVFGLMLGCLWKLSVLKNCRTKFVCGLIFVEY